jgi:hypothetical protein
MSPTASSSTVSAQVSLPSTPSSKNKRKENHYQQTLSTNSLTQSQVKIKNGFRGYLNKINSLKSEKEPLTETDDNKLPNIIQIHRPDYSKSTSTDNISYNHHSNQKKLSHRRNFVRFSAKPKQFFHKELKNRFTVRNVDYRNLNELSNSTTINYNSLTNSGFNLKEMPLIMTDRRCNLVPPSTPAEL